MCSGHQPCLLATSYSDSTDVIPDCTGGYAFRDSCSCCPSTS